MGTVDICFALECSGCGKPLEGRFLGRSMAGGSMVLEVDVCESCLLDAEKEAENRIWRLTNESYQEPVEGEEHHSEA
jgi:hypothetical protein